MGTDGVKVAQQYHAPLRVGMGNTGEDLLGHVLGPAVGVGAATGAAVFPQRHFVVRGVDRGGGGEDQILHAYLLHDLGQHQGGIQIVVVVLPGLGDTFAYGLQTGKVDHAADLVFGKDLFQQCLITHIAFIELQTLAGEFLNTLQGFGVGIAQVVDDHHTVAAFQQFQTGVRADIARAAGYQNIHNTYLRMIISTRIVQLLTQNCKPEFLRKKDGLD